MATTSTTTSTMTVSEARAALADVVARVQAGEEVTLTRHGQPIAVIVRPEALKVRRADGALAGADAVRQLLETARRSPLPGEPALSEERADALVAEIRAARARR